MRNYFTGILSDWRDCASYLFLYLNSPQTLHFANKWRITWVNICWLACNYFIWKFFYDQFWYELFVNQHIMYVFIGLLCFTCVLTYILYANSRIFLIIMVMLVLVPILTFVFYNVGFWIVDVSLSYKLTVFFILL